MRLTLAGPALLVAAFLGSPLAAQSNRTFVSGKGTDSGACPPSAPCRTFAYAITMVNGGGEIVALDPAGYGPVTITKAVTIDGGASGASITANTAVQADGNAITVNAGPSDVVAIRGLKLFAGATGQNGIAFLAGGALYVEQSQISGFGFWGLSMGHAGKLVVSATEIRHCGSGIAVVPASGTATGIVSGSVLADNTTYGLEVLSGAVVTVTQTSASGSFDGFLAGGGADLTLDFVHAVNNTNGIAAGALTGTATVRVANSVVTQNGTGLWIGGGGVMSGTKPGTNLVAGNTNDISGTLSTGVTLD